MNLLGIGTDKNFWERVRTADEFARYREELFMLWDTHGEALELPALTYSKYKMFFESGDRDEYEHKYFPRRVALNSAALLSLIYPEEDRYLRRLMDVIYIICDEYKWSLPAHQGKLQNYDEELIDLFAAETGFALAEIYTLLGDRLEPLIKERIRREIDKRIVDSIFSREPYAWWEGGTNNWSAVCMGSVACTVMLMRPELFGKLRSRAEKTMERYLDGFLDDGICFEGCGYWYYGFGFFTVFADMVRTFTGGELDYFKLPKVKAIASFIQKMYLSGDTGVSFADGNRRLTFELGLVHRLKAEYPDEVLAYSPDYSSGYDRCGRFCLQLRRATWLNEEYYNAPAPVCADAEYYAPLSEWLVKRTPKYGFAAKGGCNDEPHNHNDVGSFIYAKGGSQKLCDLGSGSYTRQYFDPQTRYSILECSSRSHNVPIVEGMHQSAGKNFKAENVRFEDGIFSLDIAHAYDICNLESLVRSFKFTDSGFILNDKFVYSGDGDIIERFVSLCEPKISSHGLIETDGAFIEFDPTLCEVSFSSEHSEVKGRVLYFIDLKLHPSVREFSCIIK